jgi:hypothetical protein
MESWFSPAFGFDPIQATATIYGEGTNPIRWISCKNVAEFIIHSLYDSETYHTSIELPGPEALSPNQVIRLFEVAGGCVFEKHTISVQDLLADRNTASNSFTQSADSLYLCCARGGIQETSWRSDPYPGRLVTVQEYSEAVYAIRSQVISKLKH